MTDVVYKNGKILKQGDVRYIKDVPQYAINLWKKKTITKINYDVGDECVFEITKGNKKWTISLDDFFDKVIQICGEKQDD
jgi:hypothetical protein